MKIYNDITFASDGQKLTLAEDNYAEGNKAFWLIGEDFDDFSFVTVNLPGLTPGQIAINHDFTSFAEPDLVVDVVHTLAKEPAGWIRSGYVNFPVFNLKEEYA